jgi:multidrug efflux pump subunit AcrB
MCQAESVRLQRDCNLSRHDALVDAWHKRARPIVTISVAMIAGMLPIALGFGADAGFRQPIAKDRLSGLSVKTVCAATASSTARRSTAGVRAAHRPAP